MKKIKSKTDVITNSSTEVFTIVDQELITRLQSLVDRLLGPGASGRFEFRLDYKSVFKELGEYEIENLNEYLKDSKIQVKDLEDFIDMKLSSGPAYDTIIEWFTSREIPLYPSLVVVPKDPKDPKDAEIAKTIQEIPLVAEHIACYC